MAAYSNYSLQATRVLLPLVSTGQLLALLVRFDRLHISVSLSHLNQHSFMLVCASMLPILAISVCIGMRSSFYSYYHASSILLASMSGVVSIGFTAYLEVGWAVLFVAAVLFAWLLLFAQYTAEFTKANLLKAAQIQWACVHCLVVLGLVLAIALEVEAGFARRFVKLFCETQTLVPIKAVVSVDPDCASATVKAFTTYEIFMEQYVEQMFLHSLWIPDWSILIMGVTAATDLLLLSSRLTSCSLAYRERMVKIYKEHNPSKVSEIDTLMAKYVGQEHTMYLKICKKYSVQPEPEIKADGGAAGGLFGSAAAPSAGGLFGSPSTGASSGGAASGGSGGLFGGGGSGSSSSLFGSSSLGASSGGLFGSSGSAAGLELET
eukprot:g5116.t1